MSQVSYTELGPLEAGGSARARLGLEVGPDGRRRPVVLVLAPPEVLADEEALARLRRETARAGALEHPHILRVYGLVPHGDTLARVTEFADGESLRRVLERAGRLPARLAARVAADVASGLHYAHVAGNDDGSPLVHGDVRPDTVLLSFSGLARVSGYGALALAPREPDGRRVVNRRLYCAPEQLVGGRAAVQPGTDVFLLGLLLFECLSGRRPFASAEDFDQAVLSSPLPLLPGDVPERLGQVVARCTAKRAKDRFPSALAVRDALVAVAGGELPPHAELARWLAPLFPEDEPARVARRRMLEAALAAAPPAQASDASRTDGPFPVPAPRPLAADGPPPAVVAARAAPEASAPAAVAAPAVAALAAAVSAAAAPTGEVPAVADTSLPEDEGPAALPLAKYARQERGGWGLPLGVGLLFVLGVAGVILRSRSAPPPAPPAPPTATAPAPAAPAAPRVREVSLVPAGPQGFRAPERSGDAGVDAGSAEAAAPAGVQDARRKADEVPGTGVVPARGVVRQQAVPARGLVDVSAPEGASVSIDGRAVGTAPLRDVDVAAGRHVIAVTVGGARWQQAFEVKANARVRFDVELQLPP